MLWRSVQLLTQAGFVVGEAIWCTGKGVVWDGGVGPGDDWIRGCISSKIVLSPAECQVS